MVVWFPIYFLWEKPTRRSPKRPCWNHTNESQWKTATSHLRQKMFYTSYKNGNFWLSTLNSMLVQNQEYSNAHVCISSVFNFQYICILSCYSWLFSSSSNKYGQGFSRSWIIKAFDPKFLPWKGRINIGNALVECVQWVKSIASRPSSDPQSCKISKLSTFIFQKM